MSSKSLRVSDALFQQAQTQGELLSRSAAQQVEHWARLGAALEAQGLTLAQAAELLQEHRQSLGMPEVQAAASIWAYKRARQAEDVAAVQAGNATNEQMSWISPDAARQARVIDSPL